MSNKHIIFIILSLLILFLGIFFRFYKLGSIPGSLYWDEVAMLIDARMVHATGFDMHQNHWFQALFPSYGDYKLPVYIWLTSLAIAVQGYGESAVRIPSAMAGVLSILITGGIAWQLTKNKSISLASMLVIATAPWSIVFSRTGFESHLGQMFLGVSVLTLLYATSSWKESKQIPQKKIFYTFTVVAISVIFGAVATYSYFSVRFVWPVVWTAALFFSLISGYQVKVRQLFTTSKDTLLFYISVFVLGLVTSQLLLLPMYSSQLYQVSTQFRLTAPSILNQYDHALDSMSIRDKSLAKDEEDFFLSQNIFISETAPRAWYHRHWLLLRSFLKNASKQVSPSFWFVSGDQNLRHGTGQHGLFVLPLFLPAIIGIYILARKDKSLLITLLIWISTAMVPAAVPMEVPHALRSLNALIPASIIIGTGLATLFNWPRNTKHNFLFVSSFVCIFSLTFILATIQFWLYYTGPYIEKSKTFWQAGYREQAFDTLVEASLLQEQGKEFNLENSDDRFFLWLLANSSISIQEIQTIQMENYQPVKIKNIVVDPNK